MDEDLMYEDNTFTGIEKQAENLSKLKIKKEEFSKKKAALVETTASFLNEFGEESDFTQMMLEILEVVQQMEGIMKVLDGVRIAFDTIFSALNIMDEIMVSFEEMFDLSNQVSYGFVANWKRKRKFQKTLRNNQGRINQMIEYINGMSDMSRSMVTSLRKASSRMASFRKKNGGNSKSNYSDNILQSVREAAAKQKGEEYTESKPTGSDTQSQGGGSDSGLFGGNDGF